jgi:hypothetical protein
VFSLLAGTSILISVRVVLVLLDHGILEADEDGLPVLNKEIKPWYLWLFIVLFLWMISCALIFTADSRKINPPRKFNPRLN